MLLDQCPDAGPEGRRPSRPNTAPFRTLLVPISTLPVPIWNFPPLFWIKKSQNQPLHPQPSISRIYCILQSLDRIGGMRSRVVVELVSCEGRLKLVKSTSFVRHNSLTCVREDCDSIDVERHCGHVLPLSTIMVAKHSKRYPPACSNQIALTWRGLVDQSRQPCPGIRSGRVGSRS